MYRSIKSFCKLIFGYVVLAKATLPVFGLLLAYTVINLSIIGVLMDYLSDRWTNMPLMYLAAIVNAIEGLSGIMVPVVAFLADDIMGEYLMIIVSTISYIIGLSLYFIYEVFFRRRMWTLIFLLSVPFLIIGKAGQYNVEEFLDNQQSVSTDMTDKNDKQKKEKTLRMGNLILFFVAFLGCILVAVFYLAEATWESVFLIAILISFVALILFSLMKAIYIFKAETKSPMYTIYEVFKASLLKQNLPSFLNVESEEIEDVKRLKVFAPVLLSFLLYTLVEAAATTFFIEQVLNLKDGNSTLLVLVIIQYFGDYATSNLFKHFMILKELRNKIGANIAGVGFICSFICSLVASIVEYRRLQLIQKYKVVSDPNFVIPMSAFCLVPQFIITGLMKALAEKGLEDLICSRLKSETMRNYTEPFASFFFGFGKLFNVLFIFSCRRWLKKTVNDSRLDKYYLVLSCISFGNIFLYYLLVRKFGRVKDIQTEQTNSQVHIEIHPVDNADIIFEPETIDADIISITDTLDEVRPKTDFDEARPNTDLHQSNSTPSTLIQRRYVIIIFIIIWKIFFS